jgi:hypothetical protein
MTCGSVLALSTCTAPLLPLSYTLYIKYSGFSFTPYSRAVHRVLSIWVLGPWSRVRGSQRSPGHKEQSSLDEKS